MHHKTLTELSQALKKREISSTELTNIFLERSKKFNSELNCYITVTEEEALRRAGEADQALAAGKAGPLTGIPMAHKDIVCTKGIKTSCGSHMLDSFIAPYDATIEKRFKKAGMVLLGKMNMDEFAMGSSNENSYYGPVKNPWQLDSVPGGSSGGSAAAVAARLVPFATGSDTGGSIRQPASLCGISGIKPTYGRVSRHGIVAYASSLDQAGPFAQTAEDLALILNTMAGFDHRDSTSIDREVPDYTATLNDSIEGLTIGLPKEYFCADLDSKIAKCIDEAIAAYKRMGVKFVEISLPTAPASIAAYYIVATAECSSNLSRFDGIRFGYRCANPKDLDDLYKRTRSEGFGDEVKRRIMIGTYALSAGYYDAFYIKAQKIRRLIKNEFDDAFSKVDLIMSPTSPSTAFKIGEKKDDPVSMYLSDIYTISVNLAGLPCISVPSGFVNDLPVGLQLLGPHFAEARILNVAHQLQRKTDWHQQVPEGF